MRRLSARPGHRDSAWTQGAKSSLCKKLLFCYILLEFSLAGCHSGRGCVTAAVEQALSFSGLSEASPPTQIILKFHVSDQIHDA